MKKGYIIGLILLVVIIIIIIYYYYNKNSDNLISKSFSKAGQEKVLTYRLPTTVDPDKFGPSYWKAFENLAEEIPCGACREEWKSFTTFGHDIINVRKGKEIFNKDNFTDWVNRICEIKNEKNK